MNQVTTLLSCLAKEIDDDRRAEMTRFLSELYLYVHDRDKSDSDTLEEKLKSAKRDLELRTAPIALERFHMLLETYKHFPSGQKLLGFFLAQVHDVFCHQIAGKNLTDAAIDAIIQKNIVDKTIEDMGAGFSHFTLTTLHVRGMIYFLADKCYVRWDEKCSA